MTPETSPWTIASWGVAITATLGFLGLLIKNIGPWRKQISEAEERLRTELTTALTAERALHAEERRTHAVEMRAFNLERDEMADRLAKMEKTLTRTQQRHNAERALARHQLNNLQQCFDALLLLVETNPEKAPEIIVKVKDMRATQMLAEAEEKAAIRAAEIKADEGEQDHDGN